MRHLERSVIGLLRVKLSGNGSQAVNLTLNDRLPSRNQVLGRLRLHVGVRQRNRPQGDQRIVVVKVPQPVDHNGHVLENAARLLKLRQCRPVRIQPIEDLRMQRIGLPHTICVRRLLHVCRKERRVGMIHLHKSATSILSLRFAAYRGKEPPTDDLKGLLRRNRLPNRLYACEDRLDGGQRFHPALSAKFLLALRKRRQQHRIGYGFHRFRQRLEERQVALKRSRRQRHLRPYELPQERHKLIAENDTRRGLLEQLQEDIRSGCCPRLVARANQFVSILLQQFVGEASPQRPKLQSAALLRLVRRDAVADDHRTSRLRQVINPCRVQDLPHALELGRRDRPRRQMPDRQHRVRLATTKVRLELYDRISALPRKPFRDGYEKLLHTLRDVRALEEADRVLVFVRCGPLRNAVKIRGELALLEGAFKDVPVRSVPFSTSACGLATCLQGFILSSPLLNRTIRSANRCISTQARSAPRPQT